LRCIVQGSIRRQFKWRWADTAAMIYFALITISMLLALPKPGPALNNRGGFFLSALLPYFCVRFLIVDRPSLYAALSGWLWSAVPLALCGVYQMYTGDSPYFKILQYSQFWVRAPNSKWDMRPLFGEMAFRASGPIFGFIMFGWYFALWIAPATNLFFKSRNIFPWIIAYCALPVGVLTSIASGPWMMMMFSGGLCALFPFRRFWKPAVIALAGLWIALIIGANRTPMEFMALFGKDQSSSWYRVGLQNFTLKGGGMNGHWVTGYGEIPQQYNESFHDLCIHWVWLLVIHGFMGIVGFYGFLATAAYSLWRARSLSKKLEDHWLLWSLLATLCASILGMLLVTLFSEVYFIYHMFIAILVNSDIIVASGQSASDNKNDSGLRQVGVLLEQNGKKFLLRYTLRPGQRLAVVHPPTQPQPEPKKEEPVAS
ncbi:MAG TPA: hypothetical protein VGP94_12035, partial [Tepidisphaeraceae bacterium]|nr:hypothetical protein [Tepidisphaeraceae bacterium]